MEQISEFAMNHWELVTMFVTVAMALMISVITSFEGVTPFQAVNLMNQGDALILDVRNNGDYKKGHIIGALNLPAGSIQESISDLQKHKDKSILVCCQNGGESSKVLKTLKQLGFEKTQTIKGGILAWKQESFPLEREKE
mgnify:CR=1 FL=1